jgi:hypothetical protein
MSKKKQSDKWSYIIASVFTKPEDETYSHEYDIAYTAETGRTTIIRSNSDTWADHCKGEQVGHFIDDEDGIVICIEGQVITLDYAQFEALTALVMAVNQDDIELRQYKTINKLRKISKND